MATTHLIPDPNPIQAVASNLRDYCTLTKPEVNLLVLMTTAAGYYLGSTGSLRVAGLIHVLVGTLLVASGTATLNQFMERSYDARMRRTSSRPLASGRLTAQQALWFGLSLSVTGALYLLANVNRLSAVLAISTLLTYLLLYTPLKRITPLCTLLGAFPGAMPTLIGWAGASARIDRHALFLFAIVFLWQFPHFLAIALIYREDYSRAGFRMLPQWDSDGRFTKREIVGFTVVLVLITTLPVAERSGAGYFLCMLAAGAFFLYHTTMLTQSSSKLLARAVVHASVIYLPVVLAIMVAWKAWVF